MYYITGPQESIIWYQYSRHHSIYTQNSAFSNPHAFIDNLEQKIICPQNTNKQFHPKVPLATIMHSLKKFNQTGAINCKQIAISKDTDFMH